MSAFKPAYLIHGDDHGRIAERRARLRSMAEAQSGAQGVEVLEGDQATPAAVAASLDALTFALGRRFIIVEAVEAWKEKDLPPLERAMAEMPPDTTIAFFAREDGRSKAPAGLHKAVTAAGGAVDAEQSVKPWELPKWVVARARELGVGLDADGARVLIGRVGERQQRLMRELEKLALGAGPEAGKLDADDIEALAAPSAELRIWSLADAVVAGDAGTATRLYLTLRGQGERLPGLLYWMAQRVRSALAVAVALEAGEPVAEVKRTLRMPSRAADALIADARRAGSERLRGALEHIADLELASRGGGRGGASEDTVALRALQTIAG